jgi:SAM-dependent methyltransferase
MCFEIDPQDVFGRDDAAVRVLLRGLRGNVLDVGCGDGRYGNELAPAAETGQLRYTGVDPDAVALGRLRARWPWARCTHGTIGTVALPVRQWDHVLLLNSYNHIEAIETVVARLVHALRPGGTLLLSDDVPFGLVRSSQQTDCAERGPARFEHCRNHGTDAVVGLLAALPVQVLTVRAVERCSSNLWYVHCRRTAENPLPDATARDRGAHRPRGPQSRPC